MVKCHCVTNKGVVWSFAPNHVRVKSVPARSLFTMGSLKIRFRVISHRVILRRILDVGIAVSDRHLAPSSVITLSVRSFSGKFISAGNNTGRDLNRIITIFQILIGEVVPPILLFHPYRNVNELLLEILHIPFDLYEARLEIKDDRVKNRLEVLIGSCKRGRVNVPLGTQLPHCPRFIVASICKQIQSQNKIIATIFCDCKCMLCNDL